MSEQVFHGVVLPIGVAMLLMIACSGTAATPTDEADSVLPPTEGLLTEPEEL